MRTWSAASCEWRVRVRKCVAPVWLSGCATLALLLSLWPLLWLPVLLCVRLPVCGCVQLWPATNMPICLHTPLWLRALGHRRRSQLAPAQQCRAPRRSFVAQEAGADSAGPNRIQLSGPTSWLVRAGLVCGRAGLGWCARGPAPVCSPKSRLPGASESGAGRGRPSIWFARGTKARAGQRRRCSRARGRAGPRAA